MVMEIGVDIGWWICWEYQEWVYWWLIELRWIKAWWLMVFFGKLNKKLPFMNKSKWVVLLCFWCTIQLDNGKSPLSSCLMSCCSGRSDQLKKCETVADLTLMIASILPFCLRQTKCSCCERLYRWCWDYVWIITHLWISRAYDLLRDLHGIVKP